MGDKMTEIMRAKEISQKELSELTGIAPSHLSLIQNNKRTPSLENFIKIADALHCKADVLLGR